MKCVCTVCKVKSIICENCFRYDMNAKLYNEYEY